MAVFDGVQYSLSPSLSPTRRTELASILDLNGAVPHSPYTHLIALTASHAHNDSTNATADLKLVTDRWVDRSIIMGKRQPEQYYSPDPAMIFSGVVACATDLSAADLEVLSAGITALGGQWRLGLTRDVTHLFALHPGSDKYNTALHFASQTHMSILTPHWFDDAVRLGRRIPEAPYTWPDPLVLRPGTTVELNNDLGAEGKRKQKLPGTESTDTANEGERVRIWQGRRILLSVSLELSERSRAAIEAGIQRAGGTVVPIADDADEDLEEKAADGCDVLVTRWRSGKSYFKAARASLLIGTLSWLFSVESSGTLHSPLDSLLWYPTPRDGIPDLVDCEISITNYTGAARDYLKRLIVLIGAKFTPSMSQSNKVLVAGFQPSPKTTRALSWSIPVVNHTWLEDCFVEWRALTVGLERYIVYPPGIDFGKMLMTGQDGQPSSQSITPRLSGGAVPGGRGIGAINLEQDGARDAEYRARLHLRRGPLPALDPLNVSVTESRGRPSSRAGSIKKTPTSTKAASALTPVTTSVTGAFVDHVIELPADDGEDLGGNRRVLTNGKQRARGSSTSSRATPRRIPSPPSSTAFTWPPSEPEVVPYDVEDDEVEKDKGKERGKSINGSSKGQTRAVAQKEDVSPSRPSRQTGVIQGPTAPSRNTVGKGIPSQTSAEKRGRRPRARTLGSESEMLLSEAGDGGVSDASEPRRLAGFGSKTPVKSGMKGKPKSASRSGSIPARENRNGDGDGDEAKVTAVVKSGARVEKQRPEVVKPSTKSKTEMGTKAKQKGVQKENIASRLGSLTPSRPASPTSPGTKSQSSTLKRRLSVCVPPIPRDYFSSQGARNELESEPEDEGGSEVSKKKEGNAGPKRRKPVSKSVHAVATEASASASTGKRNKPSAKPTVAGMSSNITETSKTKPRPPKKVAKVPEKNVDRDEEVSADDKSSDGSIFSLMVGASTGKRDKLSAKATTTHATSDNSKPAARAKPGSSKKVAKTLVDEDVGGAENEFMVIDTPTVAEEASMSKRNGPSTRTTFTRTRTMSNNSKPAVKAKSGPSKKVTKPRERDMDSDESTEEDDDQRNKDMDVSMIVDSPMTSTSRGGPRRSAANKATMRLRKEVMPDVINFEKERKQAKRRRSMGGESVTSVREEEEEEANLRDKERNAKRRRVVTGKGEDEEVVSAPSARAKPRLSIAKGKPKGMVAIDSDENVDDIPVKSKPKQDKKGGRVQAKDKDTTVIRLMTTGVVLSDDVIKRITRLGVQMTMKPSDCTHLIAKGFVRTEKFLCAMPLSPYILREEWATASAVSGKLLLETDYILTDAAAEQRWDFKFVDAVARAKGSTGGANLFHQLTFYVTPKVSVDAKLLKNVVAAGGGQAVTITTPTVRILKGKPNRYVISCPEDRAVWRPLVQEGFKVYSPELVLRAALRQEIEWERSECLVEGR